MNTKFWLRLAPLNVVLSDVMPAITTAEFRTELVAASSQLIVRPENVPKTPLVSEAFDLPVKGSVGEVKFTEYDPAPPFDPTAPTNKLSEVIS